jgi:hypothetical protein
VLDGLGRHEVEHLTDHLQRAVQDVEVAQPFAGVVERQAELDFVEHHVACDPVAIALDVDGAQLGEDVAREGLALGQPVRGEVGHLVVVTGDAHERGRDGVQGGDPLDVVVGDPVDVAHEQDRNTRP